jgi:uncharacterized membrane protein
MASIPFAFSVHHFISTVGADAGFAAIVGLAILVFLFFAQARETASLREQAEDQADHVEDLERRIAQLARGGAGTGTIPPTPAPAPPGIARPAAAPPPAIAAARTGAAAPVAARTVAPAAAPAPAGPRTAAPVSAGIPSAPAGVGAPALNSATRLIPISETDPITAHTNGGSSPGAVASPAGLPPATAAGGANGTTSAGATAPPPRTSVRPAPRPTTGRQPPPPRRPGGGSGGRGTSGGGSRVSRGFIILMSLLGIVAVVVVLLIVTSGSGTSSHSSSTPAQNANATATPKAHGRRAATPTPASITVAVLNGTSISNLAHDVGQRLGAAGFKEGALATAADQTQTATVVGYLPGHKAGALLVAKSLKLGPASVQPVDQSNRTVACPGSSPCAAKVVVTVGSDLASTQTQ